MKATRLSEDMKHVVESIVSSYETRIKSIGSIFEITHQLLEGFQDSFLHTKQEREKINAELRDNLAKNESLRRKDFDNMMRNILLAQAEREQVVRDLLNTYVQEQKEMAKSLRESLRKFKDSLANNEARRMAEFHSMIEKTLAQQEVRKNEVTAKLKEFQNEQREMAHRLKVLLAKGKELRIKDLKLMLKESTGQQKKESIPQEVTREKVKRMPSEFEKERAEASTLQAG